MGESTGKERPILFSGLMVRALLAGTKRQTRRLLQPRHLSGTGWPMPDGNASASALTANLARYSPYGQPGDRLWVRETWRTAASLDALSPAGIAKRALEAGWNEPWCPVEYVVDGLRDNWDSTWGAPGKTRVSIHMPRWASRLTLEVTEVRVQRLQEISEEDAKAEGIQPVVSEHWTAYDPETEGYPSFGVEPDAEMIASRRLENVRHHGPKLLASARSQFQLLWDSIYGPESWKRNDWVWAISFEVRP